MSTDRKKHGTLTELQRKNLVNLWFIYGNHGKKETLSGHKFIQRLLEKDALDYRDFYKPPRECLNAVDEVLNQT